MNYLDFKEIINDKKQLKINEIKNEIKQLKTIKKQLFIEINFTIGAEPYYECREKIFNIRDEIKILRFINKNFDLIKWILYKYNYLN